MTHDVVMPQLGLTMEEGCVVCWQKQIGDWVKKGEVLFIVETDKVQMEVESMDSGYLNSVQVEIGKKVRVGTVVATLADQPGEVRADLLLTIPAPAPRAIDAGQVLPSPKEVLESSGHSRDTPLPATSRSSSFAVSPRARRLAGQLGIDISAVTPARGGRVVEEDVRHFHETRSVAPPSARSAEHPAARRGASLTRAIVARPMAESFRNAPHFYLGVEADATEMVKCREQLLAAFNQETGRRLTYTDFFLRALSLALRDFPQVNSFWRDDRVQPRDSVDVGFAVATSAGLVAPVIRTADLLTFFDLARQKHVLTGKVRAGEITLPDLEGGSATLSNLGNVEIDWFQAILNPPQSVALATGQVARRVRVVHDAIEICPTVVLSLSVDHRVLDGEAAARFLGRIKNLIEKPELIL
jgi:pyruvate dehydrogenase E2 component (dihydrolipoamide acetyltransferase)